MTELTENTPIKRNVKSKIDEEEDIPKTPSQAFDSLLSSVGNNGKWQWKMTALCSMCGLFTSMHNLGAVFLGATPDHLCDIYNTSKYTSTSIDQNLYEDIRNFSTPSVIGKEGVIVPDKCNFIDKEEQLDELLKNSSGNSWMSLTSLPHYESDMTMNNESNISEKIKCSKWDYDDSKFTSTVVTEWNLVCDNLWLKPTIQSTYMMGLLIGAVVASSFSDRFGRRPSTIGCSLLFFLCSVIAAFSPTLWFFLLFRAVVAGAGQGIYLINFVILMEVVGLKSRDLLGVVFGLAFTFGTISLASCAYFVKDWRSIQLMTSVPTVILLSYYWLMPESPRWLLMNGKTEEGLAVLREAGRINGGKQLPEEEKLKFALNIIEKEVILQRKKYDQSFYLRLYEYYLNVCKLVRTPIMRRRSLIMFYSWFVVSMTSYGASFSGENIKVSTHALILYGGLLGFPAMLFCYYSYMRFGRRLTLACSFIMGGLFCMTILFIPTSLSSLKLIFLLAARFFLGLSFRTVFFFSTELVPTDIRNISIGMASMFARIGSALAPYIVDLLGEIYYAIPTTIFGILAIIAGLLALLLPETSKKTLPETIAEIERLPK